MVVPPVAPLPKARVIIAVWPTVGCRLNRITGSQQSSCQDSIWPSGSLAQNPDASSMPTSTKYAGRHCDCLVLGLCADENLGRAKKDVSTE